MAGSFAVASGTSYRFGPTGYLIVVGAASYLLGLLFLSIFSEQIIVFVAEVTPFGVQQVREDFGQFYYYISVAFLVAGGLLLTALRFRGQHEEPDSGTLRRARVVALAASAVLVPAVGVAYAGRTWLGLEGLFVEDGPSEWFTALVFFAAAAVFAARAWRARKDRRLTALLCGAAAALLAFIALEEISYGQRLLGVATPAWLAEANDQGEITLHNMHNALLMNAYPVAGLGLFAVMSAVAWRWQDLQRAKGPWGEVAALLPDPALLPLGGAIAVVAQHPAFNELVEIYASLLLLFYLAWPAGAHARSAARRQLTRPADAASAT